MDKNTILDYVTETPGNTNRAVLEGMLDSIGGDVEFITLFDDDINITSYTPSSQYGPAIGTCFSELITLASEDGVLKVTYENISVFGIYTKTSDTTGFYVNMTANISKTPVSGLKLTDYTSPNSFTFQLYGERNKDTEFEAYCQEPHHLKIEWFIV